MAEEADRADKADKVVNLYERMSDARLHESYIQHYEAGLDREIPAALAEMHVRAVGAIEREARKRGLTQ